MTEGARSAFIVANDDYADQRLRRLRAPASDARELAGVLGDADIGGFDVELSLNEPEHVLRRRLSAFFEDRGVDDLLLLHLSCHGVKDEDGRLYFATPDTEMDHLDATSIPSDFVNRQMTRSRSRRIVLLLDCCYSGAFARGWMSRAGDRVDLKERFDGRGRIVLTASSAMEYSFEGDELAGEGRPSVFTSALVRGLSTGEADRNRDGYVSVDELYDFAYDEVRAVTPSQTPGKWVFDVQGDFYVARSGIDPTTESGIAAELLTATKSPFAYVRAGAVEELARLLDNPDETLAVAARELLAELTDDDSQRVMTAAARALQGPSEESDPSPLPEAAPAMPASDSEVSPPTAPEAAPEDAPAAEAEVLPLVGAEAVPEDAPAAVSEVLPLVATEAVPEDAPAAVSEVLPLVATEAVPEDASAAEAEVLPLLAPEAAPTDGPTAAPTEATAAVEPAAPARVPALLRLAAVAILLLLPVTVLTARSSSTDGWNLLAVISPFEAVVVAIAVLIVAARLSKRRISTSWAGGALMSIGTLGGVASIGLLKFSTQRVGSAAVVLTAVVLGGFVVVLGVACACFRAAPSTGTAARPEPGEMVFALAGLVLAFAALFLGYDGLSSLWTEVGEGTSAEFFFEPGLAVPVALVGIVVLGSRPRVGSGILSALGVLLSVHYVGIIIAAWRAVGEVGEVRSSGFVGVLAGVLIAVAGLTATRRSVPR